MPYIYVPFWVEPEILEGLKLGEYERKGGVIRRRDNKRIVCWLKQEGKIPESKDISRVLFKIIAGSADVEALSDIELIELGSFINSHENLASFNFYQGCKGAVGAITRKYQLFFKRGDTNKAKEYAHTKRQALINLFARTYIPNLKHQVELHYITMVPNEKTGLITFVKKID